MVAPSRILIGRPAALEETESVFAYGDYDDPARVVVLLASRVRDLCPSSEAAKAAQECLAPRTPWRKRLDHLREALADAATGCERSFVAFWDFEAFDPVRWARPISAPRSASAEESAGAATTWGEGDERDWLAPMRCDVRRLIMDSAREDGGWSFVRTARPAVFAALDELDLPVHEQPDDPADRPEEIRLFAPECRPVARWLVERGILQPRDLAYIDETVGDRADEHVVDLAYEALPNAARDAAVLFSTLRAPREMNGNGRFGPVAFADVATVTATAVPTETRTLLKAAGLLQETTPRRWRMPRIARMRLARLAGFVVEESVHQLHQHEAHAEADSPSTMVEVHHHAVQAHDLDRAWKTATYYGTGLNQIATRISREAKTDRDYLHAASVFQRVLDNFDPSDAYAWEYVAYNLARGRSTETDRILAAYRRAHELRPSSPLYHGRLLGFEGEQGRNIVAEALAGIRTYAARSDDGVAVAYFAEAVFRGLNRRDRALTRGIIDACRPLLLRRAPQLLLRYGHGTA